MTTDRSKPPCQDHARGVLVVPFPPVSERTARALQVAILGELHGADRYRKPARYDARCRLELEPHPTCPLAARDRHVRNVRLKFAVLRSQVIERHQRELAKLQPPTFLERLASLPALVKAFLVIAWVVFWAFVWLALFSL